MILNVAGLALDAILYRNGIKTITARATDDPIIGIIIVALQILAAAALALHFAEQ